jgi:hypothetical protein
MLRPIKTFYAGSIPTYEQWEEAVQIAKTENCVVEVRWMPNSWTGWYHEYVFEDSNPLKLCERTPRVYGV